MGARHFKIAAIAGGVAGCAVVAGFGPYVRYRAEEAASAYGAAISIDKVRPTWGGVEIRGVDVRLSEVPSATVHLDQVQVELGLSGRRVMLRGGTLAAVGPREVVLGELEGWRASHPGKGSGSGSGSSSSTDVEGLRLVWKDRAEAPTESVSASGVRFSRADGRTSIAASEATVAAGGATVAIRDGRVVLVRGEGGYRVADLAAGSVDAEVTLAPPAAAPADEPEADPGSPARAGAEEKPTRPRTAKVSADKEDGRAEKRDRRKAKRPASADEEAGEGRDRRKARGPGEAQAGEGEGRDRGALLREALIRAAQGLDKALAEGAKVELGGVTARLRRGEDRLGLGPGNLSVRRDGGALLVELSPGAGGAPGGEAGRPAGEAAAAGQGGEQALTFRLRVPLSEAAGTPQEIVADVNGGPIWLSTLGLQDGDLGLFDVGKTALVSRAHVVLSGDGQSLSIDGEGRLQNLSLRSSALSDQPVAGLDLAWRARATARLDGSRVDVADGEVDLGAIRLLARGEYRRVGHAHRVRGELEVPLTACQAMLDSAPQGLVARVKAMRLAGSFGIKGKARFDTAQLDREFELRWDTSNTCRVVEAPPELHVDRFKRAFRRKAYGPDGRPVEVESGPGTAGWAPYRSISRFMEVAVMTTEDSGFHRHRGFDEEAIRNSIRENLRRRRFVRGASTISMQLAKNLYLERTKNVARKLQEAVLTMYLEQELTKEQIMELYLNVVEFGPMVFGINAASQHYFSTSASQLSLSQALYVASILPNPKVQHFAAGGAVTPGWSNYLRKLMVLASKRQWISDEELEEGLRETAVRGSPQPQLTDGPGEVAGPGAQGEAGAGEAGEGEGDPGAGDGG